MDQKKILLFCFAFLLILSPIFAKAEINIDILENTPYIDYTLPFTSSFSIDLPDFGNLIYLKVLPSDINYIFNNGKLTINSATPGTLVLKYEGTDFLDNHSFYDKTLDFNIFQETTINIQCDKNISKINTLEINNTNYSIKTSEPTTLHILIEKDPFRWQNILIISLCLAFVIIIMVPILLKKFPKEKKKKLYLDATQQKVYDTVKKQKEMTQQSIANQLNLNKSHLSKILNKMERNDLIERKKVGKVNKIILTDNKK